MYIVHTRADTRIDSSQSEQLAAAAQAAGADVTAWFPEDAEHVQTPTAYPQEFEDRLVVFFRGGAGKVEMTRDANPGRTSICNLDEHNS